MIMRLRVIATVMIAFAGSATLSAAQTVLEKAARDEVVMIPKDDPDMAAAMRKARATLPEFFALARAPRPSTINFSVKVGVAADHGGYEFFWVRPFADKGTEFTGTLRNRPRMVKRLKEGDTIAFSRNDIVDWTYLDDGKMKGNFTACAILKRQPKKEADAFKKQYRLECDF